MIHCSSAERRLRGVSYIAELLSKNQNNLGGVRYTAEAIAKGMKATTVLKVAIPQTIDQNFKFVSYSIMTMNLKFFIFGYLREFSEEKKSSQSSSNGTRKSNLMQKSNIQKSRDTAL